MTAPIVLDSSVAMTWCFPNESSPYAYRVLGNLATRRVIVPSVWPLEIANAAWVGERRGRIRPADTELFANLIESLVIEVDYESTPSALQKLVPLGREFQLSVYDASFLELAMRTSAVLATLDGDLVRAARTAGVALFEAP